MNDGHRLNNIASADGSFYVQWERWADLEGKSQQHRHIRTCLAKARWWITDCSAVTVTPKQKGIYVEIKNSIGWGAAGEDKGFPDTVSAIQGQLEARIARIRSR